MVFIWFCLEARGSELEFTASQEIKQQQDLSLQYLSLRPSPSSCSTSGYTYYHPRGLPTHIPTSSSTQGLQRDSGATAQGITHVAGLGHRTVVNLIINTSNNHL